MRQRREDVSFSPLVSSSFHKQRLVLGMFHIGRKITSSTLSSTSLSMCVKAAGSVCQLSSASRPALISAALKCLHCLKSVCVLHEAYFIAGQRKSRRKRQGEARQECGQDSRQNIQTQHNCVMHWK